MTTKPGVTESKIPSCCSGHPTASAPPAQADAPRMFSQFREHIEDLRADTADTSAGPAVLALTVAAEALAIAEAMSRLEPSAISPDSETVQDPTVYNEIYTEIDARYVEHRTRALRSALHGVDDYIWWGGLVAATAG